MQSQGERSYHIFYQVLEECIVATIIISLIFQVCRVAQGYNERSSEHKPSQWSGRTARRKSVVESSVAHLQHAPSHSVDISVLGLSGPENYDILNQSGCLTIEGWDDRFMFQQETESAFENLGFQIEEVLETLKVRNKIAEIRLCEQYFSDCSRCASPGQHSLQRCERQRCREL
jgi:hypothetical protein